MRRQTSASSQACAVRSTHAIARARRTIAKAARRQAGSAREVSQPPIPPAITQHQPPPSRTSSGGHTADMTKDTAAVWAKGHGLGSAAPDEGREHVAEPSVGRRRQSRRALAQEKPSSHAHTLAITMHPGLCDAHARALGNHARKRELQVGGGQKERARSRSLALRPKRAPAPHHHDNPKADKHTHKERRPAKQPITRQRTRARTHARTHAVHEQMAAARKEGAPPSLPQLTRPTHPKLHDALRLSRQNLLHTRFTTHANSHQNFKASERAQGLRQLTQTAKSCGYCVSAPPRFISPPRPLHSPRAWPRNRTDTGEHSGNGFSPKTSFSTHLPPIRPFPCPFLIATHSMRQ